MKAFWLLLLYVLISVSPSLASKRDGIYYPFSPTLFDTVPKYETRAVWLTTLQGLDWPSTRINSRQSIAEQQAELHQIILKLAKAGINTVLFQTRLRATTIYPSRYEPWDECLTGRPDGNPQYDPLAFVVEECHRYGIEIHAWVVTLPIGKWQSYGCRQIRREYPELVKRIGADAYLNPEKSGTAEYLSNICGEITEKYDIDGIHLDYLRYPETWSIRGRESQARQYITHIASAITSKVKAIKPWIKVSCSPIGKHDDLPLQSSYGWNARTRVGQDAQVWLSQGVMDELYPMMYFRNQHFFPFALDWQEHSSGRNVVAGLGLYQADSHQQDWPITDITRQIQFSRDIGLGQCYFRSKFLTDNTKGIYNILRQQYYAYPALTHPTMSANIQHITAPTSLERRMLGDTLLLSWSPVKSDIPHLSYTLYADTSWPVDTKDARNIILSKIPQSMIAVRHAPNIYFAVTANNAYGAESTACQEQNPSNNVLALPTAQVIFYPANKLSCAPIQYDSYTIRLPQQYSAAEFNSVMLFDHTSRFIRRISCSGSMFRLPKLDAGTYYLISLSKKNKQHLLGTIIITKSSIE